MFLSALDCGERWTTRFELESMAPDGQSEQQLLFLDAGQWRTLERKRKGDAFVSSSSSSSSSSLSSSSSSSSFVFLFLDGPTTTTTKRAVRQKQKATASWQLFWFFSVGLRRSIFPDSLRKTRRSFVLVFFWGVFFFSSTTPTQKYPTRPRVDERICSAFGASFFFCSNPI